MRFIPAKIPTLVKCLFPNYVWEQASEEPTIYLTFDDGPTPEITNWILNLLKQYNAKATFFCIGDNIKKHPDLLDHILKAGHQIGNHTFNHLSGWKSSTENYIDNALKAEHIIQSHTEAFRHQNDVFINYSNSKLFRPPYGKIKGSQAKKLIDLGYKIIMWDIISFDWDQNVSVDQCYQNAVNKAESGSIIVFHDSKKAFKNLEKVLPKVLEHFYNKGYTFKVLR